MTNYRLAQNSFFIICSTIPVVRTHRLRSKNVVYGACMYKPNLLVDFVHLSCIFTTYMIT